MFRQFFSAMFTTKNAQTLASSPSTDTLFCSGESRSRSWNGVTANSLIAVASTQDKIPGVLVSFMTRLFSTTSPFGFVTETETMDIPLLERLRMYWEASKIRVSAVGDLRGILSQQHDPRAYAIAYAVGDLNFTRCEGHDRQVILTGSDRDSLCSSLLMWTKVHDASIRVSRNTATREVPKKLKLKSS